MNKKIRVALAILLFSMVAVIIVGNYYLKEITQKNEKSYEINIEKEQPIQETNQRENNITTREGADRNPKKEEEVKETVPPEEKQENEANIETSNKEDVKIESDNSKQVGEEDVKAAMKINNPNLTISAKNAILLRGNTKEVLFHKDALEKIQPASTAKLLTAIVAVEHADSEEEFKVGNEIELIASDSSRAYLKKGQVLSLSQTLDALLLPSGNDTAYMIAVHIGRKIAGDTSLIKEEAVKVFVEEMNRTAKKIGAVHSNFCTPDGYDSEGQYTTAYDMAVIGANAIEYDLIVNTVKKEKARDILLSGEDITWNNSNKLIIPGSGYYYKYAIGLKTGTSTKAGKCLVSAAKIKGNTYVSVVMDASYEGRWQDSVDLLKYGVSSGS